MFDRKWKEKKWLWFAVGVVITGSSGSFAFSPWDGTNDPANLEADYERNFYAFPESASVARLPWADTYWPSANRGLAWRWCDEPGKCQPLADEQSGTLRVKTPEALVKLSSEELRRLSPIEKFDIYLGHTDRSRPDTFYFWLKSEIQRTSPSATNPVIDGWEGLCNGWAAASIQHPEPRAVKAPVDLTVNGETVRIELPFSSSDIKGLMSLYYFLRMRDDSSLYRALGGRCEGYSSQYAIRRGALRRRLVMNNFSAECEDTNAGAFHLVLMNQIGKRGEPFIADIDPGKPVWNHPVTGYSMKQIATRAPSPGASPEAVKEVVVETTMYYMVEANPARLPFGSANSQALAGRVYRYAVELARDQNGEATRIVGGSWLSADRPDFLWKMNRIPFKGAFSVLDKLLVPVEQ